MIWHLVELFLYACAAAGIYLTHRHTQQRLEARAIERASAIQKNMKAVSRIRRQSVEEFRVSHDAMAEESRRLQEDTRLMHQRADALLREVSAMARTYGVALSVQERA